LNIYFLLLASTLILIAFVFILPTLWRQRVVKIENRNDRNLEIAKQRLQELKEQLQSGILSQTDYDLQRTELEQSLSDDFTATNPTSGNLAGRWIVYIVIILLPVVSIGLYTILGAFEAIEPSTEMLASSTKTPNIDSIRKMVDTLAERMKSHPEDAEGWKMLGKSYKYLQQYSKAVDAFSEAYRLLGDQVDILLLYADALAFAQDEQLQGRPTELVFKALALEPNNTTALWLGGMAKAQLGDTSAASQLWKKLLTLLPPNSPEQQEVQNLLSQLSNSEVATPPTDIGKEPFSETKDITITINVSLAPELQKMVAKNDTVFVYAQALSGPKMPLAIVRKTVNELPLSLQLTNAMAMTPTMQLANFQEVKLLARISKTGNAMTQPGDLIGTIESVSTNDKNPHTLIINGVIK